MPRSVATLTPSVAAVEHLRRADVVLGGLIDRIGTVSVDLDADYFSSLASAIVGQQLSNAAAATIWKRLEAALGGVTPESVLSADNGALRSVGLSQSKTAYLRDLSLHVADGRLDLDHIATLGDEDVIEQLTAVKGIGRWTAEMFLIFALGRPDVFALDDGALRSTVAWLYDLPERDRAAMELLGERWKPHRTAASLYLWEALDLRREDQRSIRI